MRQIVLQAKVCAPYIFMRVVPVFRSRDVRLFSDEILPTFMPISEEFREFFFITFFETQSNPSEFNSCLCSWPSGQILRNSLDLMKDADLHGYVSKNPC